MQVELEAMVCTVYVMVRPGCLEFIKAMSLYYEIIIFTASLAKYANPVINKLGIHKYVDDRLFRQHCTFHQGMYIKDMERLGRNISDVILLDNSPISYIF